MEQKLGVMSTIDITIYDKAECKDVGLATFFPEKPKSKRAVTVVKKYCRVCSVRESCLAIGLESYDRGGIWGGLTYRQRVVLRNKYPDKTCLCGTEVRCYVHD